MNDKIPSISDSPKKDRSELNVGGRSKKNKSMVIGILLLLSLVVIVGAVLMAFSGFDEQEEAIVTTNEANYEAGLDKSVLDGSENFFKALSEDKRRKEEAEADRLAREAKEQGEQNNAVPVKPVTTVNTPNDQPAPQVTVTRTSSNSGANRDMPPTPEQRKQMGAVMVNLGGNKSTSPNIPREFDNSFNASSFANGSATLRKAGALDFMLIHGTAIPCALYTQIISDYEGFVTCRVTQDVYSANGAALLVERGSVVSGTQKVAMELGKNRIFTNWADIETPLGVSIRIDSLGAGALGASGSEAWVDNHFGERFGGAILLSFVDDALGALSGQASKDSNIQFDNSTDNASEMAAKALESSINIAPTGYSYIGQRINILVARDIDMSSIYRFEEVQ